MAGGEAGEDGESGSGVEVPGCPKPELSSGWLTGNQWVTGQKPELSSGCRPLALGLSLDPPEKPGGEQPVIRLAQPVSQPVR